MANDTVDDPDTAMEDISNVSSISAAAAAYQAAMALQDPSVKTEAEQQQSNEVAQNLDLPPAQAISAAEAISTSTTTPSQTPAPRNLVTNTSATNGSAINPSVKMNSGTDANSRATSQHPEQQAQALPTEVEAHGAFTRRYLADKITPYMMEGMRQVAVQKPTEPLRFLGEFLLEKSREIEK